MSLADSAVPVALTGCFTLGGIWLGWRLNAGTDESHTQREVRHKAYEVVIADMTSWVRAGELLSAQRGLPGWHEALLAFDEARVKADQSMMLAALVVSDAVEPSLSALLHTVSEAHKVLSGPEEDRMAVAKALFTSGYVTGDFSARARVSLGHSERMRLGSRIRAAARRPVARTRAVLHRSGR